MSLSREAAQTFNSGIFDFGSRALLVRVFAAASAKWKGMKITPCPTFSVTLASTSTLPRRDDTFTLSPWPMLSLYSPDFARFLTAPAADNPLARKLFDQLRSSDGGRQAFDLAVRLTPDAALHYLAE